MPSYKIPQGTIDAARALLAQANHLNVDQAHEVILREVDGNEDDPDTVHLIPLGGVLGIVITKDGAPYKDEDLTIVSMEALGNALGSLGFKLAYTEGPSVAVIPPRGLQSAYNVLDDYKQENERLHRQLEEKRAANEPL